MDKSTWIALQPFLAQGARDLLRTVGTALAAHGYITTGGVGVEAFIGAGMTLAGLFWGWWTTSGYLQAGALLKKLTATKTAGDAVKAAQVLPPAAAVDTTSKAISVQSVTGAVAKIILLVAFALAALAFPGDAHAQGLPKVRPLTGNIVSNADLTYASALAGSAGTASSGIRKQCWDAIIKLNQQANGANLKNADGTVMVKPDPHLFTDVEQLAEVIDNLSPQGPLFTSCAGAAQLAKTNVLTFINSVVTGAAGLAAMPIIPGL
jgi:hypothetical protein